MNTAQVFTGDCLPYLHDPAWGGEVHLTFLDPPFNQNKEYQFFDDNLSPEQYWEFMRQVCDGIYQKTAQGGAVYFMQREKNTEFVLSTLRQTGWSLQNIIIWKKKTSAVPVANKFGKHYQTIVYATKGEKARVFNRLRIDPPLPAHYKQERENGVFVTDVWDDIRELTSGYFAGDEALRTSSGERFHKQQSPLALLIRILLSSSMPGDTVLDPFAGTGTTLVAAQQLARNSLGIEIDPTNAAKIQERLRAIRLADEIDRYGVEYRYTERLSEIWGKDVSKPPVTLVRQPSLLG